MITPDLTAELADLINAELGAGAAEDYDLAELARDVRRYATKYRTPRSDRPADLIEATTRDLLFSRVGAYRRNDPHGDRIEHDDVLDRERRRALLSEMFGDDAPPVKAPARRVTVERPAPDVGWPSAFERAEAEKQRLRDAGRNL